MHSCIKTCLAVLTLGQTPAFLINSTPCDTKAVNTQKRVTEYMCITYDKKTKVWFFQCFLILDEHQDLWGALKNADTKPHVRPTEP